MKYFIQFHGAEVKDLDTYTISNGFSSIWKRLEKLGTVMWLSVDDPFPDLQGDIYVSCCWGDEIDYVFEWAKQMPHLFFIVGGPMVSAGVISKLTNVKMYWKQAYELFDGSYPTPDEWKLELPNIEDGKHIRYLHSISFGEKCHWGKCVFCKYGDGTPYEFPELKIPIVEYHGLKTIWINTKSLTSNNIKMLIPNMEWYNDVFYVAYLRPSLKVKNAFEEVQHLIKKPNHLSVNVGVEFPSDHMLQFMRKGFSMQHCIDTINTMTKIGINVQINTISAWPNLKQSDIDQVKIFVDSIKRPEKITVVDHMLVIGPNTKMYYLGDWPLEFMHNKYLRPFYKYALSDEQKKLNDQATEIFNSSNFTIASSYAQAKKSAY